MPTNITGDPANITTPLSSAIISCSSGAGGLVLVGTSTAHQFATDDYVTITGVLGTTEANTGAKIEVISSTTFLLDGVPFINAYSSGGTATDVSLTPYFQVPDNGEAGTVDSILAAIETLADRTQYLKNPAFGQSITRVQNTTPWSSSTSWESAALTSSWVSLATAKIMFVPVDIPNGAVWTGAIICVAGTGSGGNLPASPIAFAVGKQNIVTGAVSTLSGFSASYVDPSVSYAAYTAGHPVAGTGGTEVIDKTLYRYFIEIVSESGANSGTLNHFYAASVIFRMRSPDPGAA